MGIRHAGQLPVRKVWGSLMEYFIWYGIYLILKELKILPEHVPRGTLDHDQVFSIPKDASKWRSIAFCHCDFVEPVQLCTNVLQVFYKSEYMWHNKGTMQEITVWLHCPSCGAQGVFSSIHPVLDGHQHVSNVDKAIDQARNQLKIQSTQSKGKN
jgi:hypothetical protein